MLPQKTGIEIPFDLRVVRVCGSGFWLASSQGDYGALTIAEQRVHENCGYAAGAAGGDDDRVGTDVQRRNRLGHGRCLSETPRQSHRAVVRDLLFGIVPRSLGEHAFYRLAQRAAPGANHTNTSSGDLTGNCLEQS